MGLTQAPQLLSYWVPSLSHAFLPAAVVNNDLHPDGQVSVTAGCGRHNQYDNPALQKVLLKRLTGRVPFSLRLYLDAEMFAGRVPHFQRPRVRELFEAGAKVLLCRGLKNQGAFHCKGIVVDRRFFTLGVPMPLTSPTAMKSFAFASLGQLSARFWRGCPHICRRASFGMVLDGTGGYMCCPLVWELALSWQRK